jgi:hypothetical protein
VSDQPRQLRIVTIDMACGCGARLFVEWPLESGYVHHVTELAKAFVAAHKCSPEQKGGSDG